jgi:hypothetical protein
MLALTGFATSIDAMAIGVGLAFLDVPILPVAAAIGLTTFLLVTAGVLLGRVSATSSASAPSCSAASVLIGIGIGDPGRASRPGLTRRPTLAPMGSTSSESSPRRPRVGLIGLGAMGSGMAGRCAAPAPTSMSATHATASPSASPPTAAPRAARPPSSPRAARSSSRSSSTRRRPSRCCSATAADRRRGRGDAPGSVFVMCSTVDPNVSIAFERRLEAMGLLYVDAPISGGAPRRPRAR